MSDPHELQPPSGFGPGFDEPPDDPADALSPAEGVAEPADVRKRQRRARKRVQTAAGFWQRLLATEEGRAEVWAILDHAGTFDMRAGVGPNGFPQPEVTMFNLGQKAVGEWLYFRLLAYDPAGTATMLEEHQPFVVATQKEARTAKVRRTKPRRAP